jgi:hypothetical protein
MPTSGVGGANMQVNHIRKSPFYALLTARDRLTVASNVWICEAQLTNQVGLLRP